MRPTHSLSGSKNVDRVSSFWMKVNKKLNSDCWEWMGSRNKGNRGYGQFWIGHTFVGAHRFSYELHHGKIPDGLEVCHHCDNPACVNPDHLFLGTHKENEEDKKSKNRQARGKAVVHQNKINENDVVNIRNSAKSYDEISKEYGISSAMVYYIKSRRSWKWVE